MTNPDKKKYNRENYLKNKQELLNKAKSRYKAKGGKPGASRVIPLFSSSDAIKPPPPPKAPKRKMHLPAVNWSAVLLAVLVLTISGFLFAETAKFYSEFDGGSRAAGYLKARAVLLKRVAFQERKASLLQN